MKFSWLNTYKPRRRIKLSNNTSVPKHVTYGSSRGSRGTIGIEFLKACITAQIAHNDKTYRNSSEKRYS